MLTSYMYKHFGARIELQLFAALNGERADAASAANQQTDAGALTAADEAAENGSGARADGAALERLLAAAA